MRFEQRSGCLWGCLFERLASKSTFAVRFGQQSGAALWISIFLLASVFIHFR